MSESTEIERRTYEWPPEGAVYVPAAWRRGPRGRRAVFSYTPFPAWRYSDGLVSHPEDSLGLLTSRRWREEAVQS